MRLGHRTVLCPNFILAMGIRERFDIADYVKTLQDKQVLRYDDIKNKSYSQNLFINNLGNCIDGCMYYLSKSIQTEHIRT